MLLLSALFVFFISGFWLYCLVDVVLTPSDETGRLPKAAWIAIVAGTFVIGAVIWLAARRPAQPTLAPRPPGSSADGPPASQVPVPRRDARDRRDRRDRRAERRDRGIRNRPGNGERPGNGMRPGSDEPRPADQPDPGGGASGHRPVGPDDDPGFLRSLDRAIHGADAGDEPAAG